MELWVHDLIENGEAEDEAEPGHGSRSSRFQHQGVQRAPLILREEGA